MRFRTLGVYAETAAGERRVALVPDVIDAVTALGLDVLVETGAGRAAWFSDGDYQRAGAKVASRETLLEEAGILVGVRPPNLPVTHRFHTGQVLICLLRPLAIPFVIRRWADDGLTTIGMDLLPPSLRQGAPVDVLTPQAELAGYEAVLIAAETYGRCLLPSRTVRPATERAHLLVLGAGTASLRSSITTACRLGATVCAYDVRPRARQEVTSLGAHFLDIADDRHTRDMRSLRESLGGSLSGFDIVVAVTDNPDTEPEMLVSARAVQRMRRGSVIVDATVGPLGATVELADADNAVVVAPGITIVGESDPVSRLATSASTAYAHGIVALLERLVHGGSLTIDVGDPVQGAMVVTHDRVIRNDAVWQAILDETAMAGLP